MANCGTYLLACIIQANGALLTLLNIMVLPAVLMMAVGGMHWYRSRQLQAEDKMMLGRRLIMFGAILLLIVIITTYFLTMAEAKKQGVSL